MGKKTKIFLLEFIILIVICSFDSRLLLSFLWVLLHEAVHIIVAKGFGVDLYSVQVNIIGAKAEFKEVEDISENKKLILFMAGPLFNMIIAIIFMWIKVNFNVIWVERSIEINIVLALFNMLPAYPLDGMRIYDILLGKIFLYKKTKKILIRISFIIAGAFIVLFLSTIYIHKANFSLLLAGILITYTTFLEKENTIYILMGNIIKKRKILLKEDYIENKNISVYYKKDLVKLLSLVDRNKFNSFFVLDEEMRLLGVLHEDELLEGLKEYGNITVGDFINIKNK